MAYYDAGQRDEMIFDSYPYIKGVARRLSKTFKLRGMNEEDYMSIANEKLIVCSLQYSGRPEKFKFYVARAVRNAVFSIRRSRNGNGFVYLEEIVENGDNGKLESRDFADKKAENPAVVCEQREELKRIKEVIGEDAFMILKLLSEEYSYEEIASMLSTALGTVSSRIARAREKVLIAA